MTTFKKLVASLFVLVLIGSFAFAQTETGQVSGTVTDSSVQ